MEPIDIKVTDNKTVKMVVSPGPSSPLPSYQAGSSSALALSSSHRSRKEKLVVRSFSTESNDSLMDMEPQLLTREEFLREKRRKPKSKPSSGQSTPTETPRGSRESSPTGNSPSSKKYLNDIDSLTGGELDDGGVHSGPPVETNSGPSSLSKSTTSEPSQKGSSLGITMKIKKSSGSFGSQLYSRLSQKKKHKDKDKQGQRKVTSYYHKKASSILSKYPSKYNTFSKLMPGSFPKMTPAIAPPVTGSTASMRLKSGVVHRLRPPTTKRTSTSLFSSQNGTLKQKRRKLVKYRINEQWLRRSEDKSETEPESVPGTLPPPKQPLISARRSSLRKSLSSPAAPNNGNSHPSNKSNRIESTDEKKDDLKVLSAEEMERLKKSAKEDAQLFSRGLKTLQELSNEYDSDQVTREGMSIPQICAQAVAKLVGIGLTDKTKSSDNTKKLLQNKGAPKELQDLIEDNNEEGHFSMFAMGWSQLREKCFSATTTPTLPRIRREELEVLSELLTPDEDFELFEDELEMVKMYIHLMKAELMAYKAERDRKRKLHNMLNSTNGDSDDKETVVDAFAIPVNFSSEEERIRWQNEMPGLIVSKEELTSCITEDDGQSRRLRSGKEVPILTKTNVQQNGSSEMETDEVNKSPSPDELFHSSLSFTLPISENEIKCESPLEEDSALRLRDGKIIANVHNVSDIFRSEPFFKASITLDAIKSRFETKPTPARDEYSQKVEANIKRLQSGGKDYEYDYKRVGDMKTSIPTIGDMIPTSVVVKAETTTGSGLSYSSTPSSPLKTVDSKGPLSFCPTNSAQSFRRNLFSVPSESGSSSCSPSPPLSITSLSSPQRSRYSRKQHSAAYPPFDNNHCSFTMHHCPFPRAPGSRFCLSHADEGATLQFDRCKYVKESRECGRFIPKMATNALNIFCDLHAALVAKARMKKVKQERNKIKPTNQFHVLLTQISNNIDRIKGAIMEETDLGQYVVRKDLYEDEQLTVNDSSGSDSEDEDVAKLAAASVGDDETDAEDCQWEGDVDSSDDSFSKMEYDGLKNAGYFTVHEVININAQKLKEKRRSLHRLVEIDKLQFKHYWQQYCKQVRNLRGLKVPFSTDPKFISTSALLSPYTNLSVDRAEKFVERQMKVYNETKALLNHASDKGSRALLRRQALKRRHEIFAKEELKRAKLETKEEIKIMGRQRPPQLVCIFGAGGGAGSVKCSDRALPLSRYCKLHITEDRFQKLYKICGFKYGPDPDDVCKTPVHTELEKFGCALHALPILPKEPPPTLKENRKPKVEEDIDKMLMEDKDMQSENEMEDSAEYDEEEMVKEMEQLIGDEVVDLNHFWETVRYIHSKGIYVTDSEESDDTEEDDDDHDQTSDFQIVN